MLNLIDVFGPLPVTTGEAGDDEMPRDPTTGRAGGLGHPRHSRARHKEAKGEGAGPERRGSPVERRGDGSRPGILPAVAE